MKLKQFFDNFFDNKEKKPKISYYSDGKTIFTINEYNENGQKNKTTFYQGDGKTIKQINEYNENEKLIKITNYQDDGKTIYFIHEYNENGQKTKVKFYQNDGKTIKQINEYNENEKLVKETLYKDDGKTIQFINEYNENGQKTKVKFYQNDGKTIKQINEYNENEKLVKETLYKDDGKTIQFINEYKENGQKPNNNLKNEVEKLKNGFNRINDKIKRSETAKEEEIKKFDPKNSLEKDDPRSQTKSNTDNEPFPKVDLNKMPSFNQLIGFKEEREVADRFLTFSKNVGNIPNVGEIRVPTGILLHGVAGTGKTTFAQALAKEANFSFFNTTASQFSKGLVGEAPKMVRDLFDIARQEAQKSGGAVIFIDECEEVFKDLSTNNENTAKDTVNIINEFKAQMTSFENDSKKTVFLMAATNHVNKIDEAIKSRFSYIIEIKPGNFEERKEMFEFLIKKRKNPYSPESKDYLLNVVNKALDQLPPYKRANRILTSILDEAVSTLVLESNKTNPPRTQINIDDIKTAYRLRVDKDTKLLDIIDNHRKQQQETPK
jgi:cell division protease FtsH